MHGCTVGTVVVVVVEEEKGKPIKVGTHARTRGRPGTQFVVWFAMVGRGVVFGTVDDVG